VHILPIVVWIGVLGVVLVLFHQRAQRFEFLGVAQGRSYQVAATTNGRLKAVHVELFDSVKKGYELAVMDTVADNETLQEQLNIVHAEVKHLQAQLAPIAEQVMVERANLETDKVAALRRYMVDVENARLRTLEMKSLLESDRIVMANLMVEFRISENLLEQGAVTSYEVEKAQTMYDVVAKKVEENEHILEQAVRDLVAAQNRLEGYRALEPETVTADSAMEVIRQAITVQQQRIAELQARRKPLVLPAPINGLVSLIQHRAGEAVLAGDPILTIMESEPNEVVAYVSEMQLSDVKENTKVVLVKNGKRPKVVNSQVVYLGPAMELMPERLWRNPNIPQWGRPVMIKIPPNLDLLPGELVGIRGL
jgi:multidrug resistance efflux pump